ncbi:MAG: hypothetical protein V7K88_25485 [Nostoc sp.]|uniref:hypothetical protein n=1 Tax=Nostoc sp. TaxID=1180 RepID=UPI002FF79A73
MTSTGRCQFAYLEQGILPQVLSIEMVGELTRPMLVLLPQNQKLASEVFYLPLALTA